MERIRLALAQTHWHGERSKMIDVYSSLVADAAQAGAQLICLPEFTLSPYFPGTRDPVGFDWAEPLVGGASGEVFGALANEHDITIVASIFERDESGGYWDTAMIHDTQGRLAHFTRAGNSLTPAKAASLPSLTPPRSAGPSVRRSVGPVTMS